MTFDEFLLQCIDATKDFRGEGELQLEYYERGWGRNRDKIEDKPRIYVYWCIGGYSGGNCWGGEAEPYVSREKEKNLEILDVILESVCPKMPFMKYRTMCNQLEKTGDYTCSEYYGNSDDFRWKAIDLKELYDWLISEALIYA